MAATQKDRKRPRDGGSAYGRAFEDLIAQEVEAGRIGRVTEPGREVLYRPGQILTPEQDTDRVTEKVAEILDVSSDDIRVDEVTPGVSRLAYDEPSLTPVPDVMARLRSPGTWDGQPAPWVQPHHVTVGYGHVMGNPEAPPRLPVTAPTPPDPARATAGLGVTVGVCDTGMWKPSATEHADWFAGRYRYEADDVDALHNPHAPPTGDPRLALQGGHGTFVSGVLRETAPGVRIDPEVALEPTGFGDEEMLVDALAALEPGVEIVNLSLGCVTLDDWPSVVLWPALQRLCRDTVVVAAAGNAGNTRPRWPAAFKQVIGVASVEFDEHGGVRPDPDSSHGSWVDACAPGSWTTTFVRGRLRDDLGGQAFAEPYATWAGTSFAAPMVSGRIAELMTRYGLSARDAARRLLDRPRWNLTYGVLVL